MSAQLTKQSSDWGSCQWCLHPVLSQTPSLSSTSAHVASSNPARKERKVSVKTFTSPAGWRRASWHWFWAFSSKMTWKNCGYKERIVCFWGIFLVAPLFFFFFTLRMWSVTDEIERTWWFVGGVKALSVFYNSSLRIALPFFEMLDKG